MVTARTLSSSATLTHFWTDCNRIGAESDRRVPNGARSCAKITALTPYLKGTDSVPSVSCLIRWTKDDKLRPTRDLLFQQFRKKTNGYWQGPVSIGNPGGIRLRIAKDGNS